MGVVFPLLAADKSRTVVRLRNVIMELRKVVNHPVLLGLELGSPAYEAAVEARKAAAAAAFKARGESGCAVESGLMLCSLALY